MTTNEYNQCVTLYADRVFRFIVKNMKNEEDAQDIVQNTFEILWKNYLNVNFEKSRSYLFTVAYHNMIDCIRKRKETDDITDRHENIGRHGSAYNGLKEILDEALSRLPEIQKTVVLLRDYEGYNYEEIGEITGLNASQVKVYIFRARQALKNYLVSTEKLI